MGENGKKGDLKQERIIMGRVAKIPIANTFSELVEMDFVDYGDYAAFLHIQGTFSRFSVDVFAGERQKDGQTSEMARASAISKWLSAFPPMQLFRLVKSWDLPW